MIPTSAKKIIDLQIDNANFSKENSLLKQRVEKLEFEVSDLRKELEQLKPSTKEEAAEVLAEPVVEEEVKKENKRASGKSK